MSVGTMAEPGAALSTKQPLASDVMTPGPRTCSPFSTVTEAVMIFRDADCGIVPVVDGGKPVGVVTDRDVALALGTTPDLHTRPVSEIMTKDPVTVKPTASVTEIAHVFARQGIRRVLVVDDQGFLMGVIAWADVAPRLKFDVAGEMVADVVNQS